MAKRMAQFHKVSYSRFKDDIIFTYGEFDEEDIKEIYEGIQLPKRATAGSAGYDFCLPLPLVLEPGKSVIIPTGIRVEMQDNWVLMCYPRSGLGFKYKCQLNNTVGIIDSDYFYSYNEGHILVKMTNDSRDGKTMELDVGERFVQGVFLEYGITMDDNTTITRNGGIGSTTI